MTAEQKFEKDMQDPVFKNWYNGRPKDVQLLIKKYPFERFIMKPGAPYSINPEGTTVYLRSYRSKTMTVVVLPEDLLPEGREHLRYLCNANNLNFAHVLSQPQCVEVDPIWLEPIY